MKGLKLVTHFNNELYRVKFQSNQSPQVDLFSLLLLHRLFIFQSLIKNLAPLFFNILNIVLYTTENSFDDAISCQTKEDDWYEWDDDWDDDDDDDDEEDEDEWDDDLDWVPEDDEWDEEDWEEDDEIDMEDEEEWN